MPSLSDLSAQVLSHASAIPLVPVIVTAAILCIALIAPGLGNAFFERMEKAGSRIARQKGAAILLVAAASIFLRLALLPVMPVPAPEVHDEFSYLLAADTFAHGRLTNPPHPMWLYFDTFHVNQHPTYQSKYPPAQGLVLAFGEVLGHPWIGVLLSVAAMCAAIVWALQGWLPPGWALLGGVLALLRLAISSYWINSYWGGAVAAIGGALVIGALPRIIHSRRARDAVILGVGVSLLANSRPFEGMIFCLPVAAYLLFWLCGRRSPCWSESLRRTILPTASVLVLCGLFMGYYNWRGTGHPLLTPYAVNDQTYMTTPSLVWQKLRPPLRYSNPQFDAFYNVWSKTAWQLGRAESVPRAAHIFIRNSGRAILFFLVPELCLALLAIPWILSDRRVRLPLIQLAICFLGQILVVWWLQPHYCAPVTATVFLVIVQGFRHVRCWSCWGRSTGIGLVRATVLSALVVAPYHLYYTRMQPSVDNRARVVNQMEKLPGDHLVIVRYSSNHNVLAEWVYNAADIDHSKVVWAREIDGVNMQPLLDYFKNRRVWLLQPDENPLLLSPYEAATQLK